MKRIATQCFFLISALVPVSLLKAQSAVLATGANAAGSNGSVSYSVGQAAYLVKGSSRQVSEGVQQVYEITTLATGEAAHPSEEEILLYPNPFKDYLYLDFTTQDFRGSEYQLFDAQGKLIKTEKISRSRSEFNFSWLPSAMYLIRINQEGKNIKTFKIIKK
ncbi:T9SS type A sorting domain-containing protein [uncultured Chryseobacterium sp.]|uniref:T9SS type A sorting domain-containing protein n=1 Tax=uncultured Chryseobacterium sp. TaxID=259322 RepID=UPI0025FC4656|nr:T9SS type A sorting domain-containing protein [uncultured Chryseobacterium sp.]